MHLHNKGLAVFVNLLGCCAAVCLILNYYVPATANTGLAFGITLALGSISFVLAVGRHGLSLWTITIVCSFLPMLSVLLFAPSGEVYAVINQYTGLVDKFLWLLAGEISYFFFVWSLLVTLFIRPRLLESALLHAPLSRVALNHVQCAIFFIFSGFAAFVMFPRLPMTSYGNVTYPALLAGNAWMALSIISATCLVLARRRLIMWSVASFLPILWLLLNYNRVELLGYFYIVASVIAWRLQRRGHGVGSQFANQPPPPGRHSRHRTLRRSARFGVAAVSVWALLIMLFLGNARNEGWGSLSAEGAGAVAVSTVAEAKNVLLNYGTIQAVVYSAAAGLQLRESTGGYPSFRFLPEHLLPFDPTDPPPSAAGQVVAVIGSSGGMLLPVEFHMNYGLLGGLIAPFAVFFVLLGALRLVMVVTRESSFFRFAFYSSVVAMTWRLFYYAPVSILTGMIFLAPALWLLYWLTSLPRQRIKTGLRTL